MKNFDFEGYYDRFVSHYNGPDNNKLSAFAELSAIRQGIDEQVRDTKNGINAAIDSLEAKLFSICSGDRNVGEDTHHNHERDRLFQLKDDILEQYRRYGNPAEMKDSISQLHKAAGCPETVGESTILIDSIVHLKKQENALTGQQRALISVIGRIASQGYPERVKLWSELSEDEKRADNPSWFSAVSDYDDQIFKQAKELISTEKNRTVRRTETWLAKRILDNNPKWRISEKSITRRLDDNPSEWR